MIETSYFLFRDATKIAFNKAIVIEETTFILSLFSSLNSNYYSSISLDFSSCSAFNSDIFSFYSSISSLILSLASLSFSSFRSSYKSFNFFSAFLIFSASPANCVFNLLRDLEGLIISGMTFSLIYFSYSSFFLST